MEEVEKRLNPYEVIGTLMSHFGMSYKSAFNDITYQNAIMLTSSVKGGMEDYDDEEDGVDAFGFFAGMAGLKTDDNGSKESN